jgi:hypothetical protein
MFGVLSGQAQILTIPQGGKLDRYPFQAGLVMSGWSGDSPWPPWKSMS